MQSIQLESFAFNLINDLYDNYGLSDEDYSVLCHEVWNCNNKDELKMIVSKLQKYLLQATKPWYI